MNASRFEPHAAKASTLLKAMANERRLMVLFHLADGEKSVGELEKLVGLSQSALSQHLARLRRDMVVQTRRSAQTIFYSLKGVETEILLRSLLALYAPQEDADVAAARRPVGLVEAFQPTRR